MGKINASTDNGDQTSDRAGIPGYFLRIIGDLEREKLQFNWILQKNVGCEHSLTLSVPANSQRLGSRHLFRHPPPRFQKDNVRIPACSVEREAPSQRKKKSPACTKRDRKRWAKWRRSKKTVSCEKGLPPQVADANQKVLDSLPTVVSQDTELSPQHLSDSGNQPSSTDSTPGVQDNLCSGYENISVNRQPDQPSTVTFDTTLSLESISEDTGLDHQCTSTHSVLDSPKELATQSDLSREDQESAIEEELTIQKIFCVQCNKPASLCPGGVLRACGQCKVCHYCSKQCQAAHWKAGHREFCAGIAKLKALRDISMSQS